MFIQHVSDTHGKMFSYQRRNSIIIHSGDMLPNSDAIFNGDIEEEIKFQKKWVLKNISLFPKELFFIPGNHDFVNPIELEDIFKSNGIKAKHIPIEGICYNGFKIYGFPYIPIIRGYWNYELDHNKMIEKVNELVNHLNSYENEIIVAHAPLYGILDLVASNNSCGGLSMSSNIGNSALLNALNYNEHNVSMYLHGHCHEMFGMAISKNMLISNAATVNNFIEM